MSKTPLVSLDQAAPRRNLREIRPDPCHWGSSVRGGPVHQHADVVVAQPGEGDIVGDGAFADLGEAVDLSPGLTGIARTALPNFAGVNHGWGVVGPGFGGIFEPPALSRKRARAVRSGPLSARFNPAHPAGFILCADLPTRGPASPMPRVILVLSKGNSFLRITPLAVNRRL